MRPPGLGPASNTEKGQRKFLSHILGLKSCCLFTLAGGICCFHDPLYAKLKYNKKNADTVLPAVLPHCYSLILRHTGKHCAKPSAVIEKDNTHTHSYCTHSYKFSVYKNWPLLPEGRPTKQPKAHCAEKNLRDVALELILPI